MILSTLSPILILDFSVHIIEIGDRLAYNFIQFKTLVTIRCSDKFVDNNDGGLKK